MANIGYVGLGVMGGRMAKRLLDKGHTVTGFNRTKSKAQWLIDAGMAWADRPRGVAEASDITISMLSDSAAVTGMAGGPDGIIAGLGSGKTWIDMSTISPAVSRELAGRVREKGADMVDSPVSGSVSTLEAGKLTMMVGGLKSTFERVEPILLDIGPKATYIGENGKALSMKLAVNVSVAVQLIAFSEGFLLAKKSGIDPGTAVEVLTNSVVASPLVQYRGPFVLDMPDEAWFNVKMMQKDLNLVLELGREVEVPLPTASIANELMTAARAMGFGDKDFAVVFKVLQQMSGVTE
jgi:3-hydroxyisobutyrate dehydrogenase-like beta-hydroxyacid dehydrogenase